MYYLLLCSMVETYPVDLGLDLAACQCNKWFRLMKLMFPKLVL